MTEILNRDTGYTCPECGLFVKRYRRIFNSGMAVALIALSKLPHDKFVHLEHFLRDTVGGRLGDAAKLRFYDLVEKKVEDRVDGSPRNGYYRITEKGRQFVRGQVTVPSRFFTFNDQCEGFTGKEITIQEALGKKFSYSRLMSEAQYDSKQNL